MHSHSIDAIYALLPLVWGWTDLFLMGDGWRRWNCCQVPTRTLGRSKKKIITTISFYRKKTHFMYIF